MFSDRSGKARSLRLQPGTGSVINAVKCCKIKKVLAIAVSIWYFIKAVGLPAAEVITGGPLETAIGRWLQERLERKERIT